MKHSDPRNFAFSVVLWKRTSVNKLQIIIYFLQTLPDKKEKGRKIKDVSFLNTSFTSY